MQGLDENKVIELLVAFITRTKGPVQLKPDTKLLREGHLDSFGLVELIAEMEKSFGTTLGDGTLIPDDFETPRVLFERLREVAAA